MAIIKHKSQRVGIFIDTQNLYHSAKHLYKSRVNFANVLAEAVGDRVLVRAIAYRNEPLEVLLEKTISGGVGGIDLAVGADDDHRGLEPATGPPCSVIRPGR